MKLVTYRASVEAEARLGVIVGDQVLDAEALGEAGRHSRSAVSAASLPFGVAVEIEGIFQIK